ncbi:polysaccharide deacetylase family protein [Salimicrobium halophilum]|uniref:Peptidoglycan/xylan/chitin deacetylase, PgdA/CDA1 family n=1 Tax=Salimicrobium halophilum TaxID=86666 RepID=A0A1G8TW44_9BACI|nr:polysaccharide deacetylase family protein [Salimicrobium halophilum]SDJ45776.1 Peptidoglycan/xylan/chitin deacetylase, PgdA/CDA1 family [Salimicrobium halophilum]
MIRLKAMLASLLFLFVLGLAGTAWWWMQPSEETVIRKETTTASSVYPGVSIRTLTEEDDTYRSSIQVPVLPDEQMNEKIEAYITKKEAAFHEKRKSQPLKFLLERPAAFSVSFDIHSVGRAVHSLVLNVDSFTGIREPREKNALIIDLNTGKKVIPSALFQEGEFEKVKKLLKADTEREEDFFQKVFLTEKEVVMIREDGGEVSVPFYEVKDLLKEEWQPILHTEKPEPKESISKDESENKRVVTPEAMKKNPEGRQVALTFDDGPHPEYTPEILELLDEYNQTATFFLLGSRVDFYPELVGDIAESDHEIGNHTWNHKDLTTLTEEEIRKEITDTGQAIETITGEAPTYFRPPYGAENTKVRRAAGLPSILWTLDTKDWKLSSSEAIATRVQKKIEDGSVILWHDIQKATPEALEKVLIYLEEEEFETVPVSEMYEVKANE